MIRNFQVKSSKNQHQPGRAVYLTFTVLQPQLTAPPRGPVEEIKRVCGLPTEARVVSFKLQGANSEETGNIVLQLCSIQQVRPVR